MTTLQLALMGSAAGAGAGILAGLVGNGGGIVVVPVVYYALTASGLSGNEAAHVAVATSLAAIMPASIVSFLGHWRAGNADVGFLREWGPGIVIGVVVAQAVAPHVHGGLMVALFGLLCVVFAVRFGFPNRFRPLVDRPPDGMFRHIASIFIGVSSGFAGIGGGILTNIVMTLSGLPMHKSIGRAAAAGIVVSIPATIVAAIASHGTQATEIGSVDVAIWICIAPAQTVAAWFGAGLAARVSAEHLSRVFALALACTGTVMLHSGLT